MASRYSDDESDPSDIPDIYSTHTVQPYMYEPVSSSGNNRKQAVSDSGSEGSDDNDDADHALDFSSTSRLVSLEWFVFILNQDFLQYLCLKKNNIQFDNEINKKYALLLQ